MILKFKDNIINFKQVFGLSKGKFDCLDEFHIIFDCYSGISTTVYFSDENDRNKVYDYLTDILTAGSTTLHVDDILDKEEDEE